MEVHVTGFGPFEGVPINPTTTLAESVREEEGVGSVQILKVAVAEADSDLEELLAQVALPIGSEASTEEKGRNTIVLHMGVAGKAKAFRLESRGYNEANFRVPDENGVVMEHAPIDPSEATDVWHSSMLDVDALCVALRGDMPALGLDPDQVVVSHDAGRFLCNYVYFRSLSAARRSSNLHALFLHVPPVDVVPIDLQLLFVKTLIQHLVSPSTAS